MGQFSCESSKENGVFVVRTKGYFDGESGIEVIKVIEKGLSEGFQGFVLNFSQSPVINSQGVTKLLEIVEIILDEHKGKVAFVGLSDLGKNFFIMSGLLMRVRLFADEGNAQDSLR